MTATTLLAPHTAPAPRARVDTVPARAGRVTALYELALIAGLYGVYSLSRLLGASSPADAFANAYDVLRLQEALQLPSASGLNTWLSETALLAVPADYAYATLHYVVTPAVLVWLWISHRGAYRPARNALIGMSVLGVLGFTLFPLAPPRMLPGFTDTMAAFGDFGWWGAAASAPDGLAGLTNQYAAMPSLHVGWALWCGWLLIVHCRKSWSRVLGATYPVVISVVVVATANHYVVDVLAGVAVAAVAIATCQLAGPRRAHRPAKEACS